MLVTKEAQRHFEKNYSRLISYKNEFGNCLVPIDWEDNELSNWVRMLRKTENRIPLKWIELLNGIGFNFKYQFAIWSEMYALLKEYKKKHGHIRVQTIDDEHKRLERWVRGAKEHFKYFSEEQRSKLEKLGIIWSKPNINFITWEERYQQLKEYKTEVGDCAVPTSWVKHTGLYRWVQGQRGMRRRGKLSLDKKKLLDKLGFVWNVKDRSTFVTNAWQKKYEELVEFKKNNGHLVISEYGTDRSLAMWVAKQRVLYIKGKLGTLRIQQLEEIKFEWRPSKTYWWKMFEKLKQFKQKHGHLNVPVTNDRNDLYKWSNYYRRAKNSLSTEKIKALDSISFEWEKKLRKRLSFEDYYSLLRKFYLKAGHSNVPISSKNKLARWVIDIRKNKSKLSNDKIALLKAVQFNFKGRSWMDNYNLLINYYKCFGNTKVSSHYKDKELYNWARNTRNNRENLSKQKLTLLDKINFNWNKTK